VTLKDEKDRIWPEYYNIREEMKANKV